MNLPRMSKFQFAYQSGKSIDEALTKVVDKIELGLLSKKYTMAAFLDISGAFDNVSVEACLEGARRGQIPNQYIKWFDSLLRNRVITTNVNGIEQSRLLNNGTPQGDVCSPKLFCLSLDHILTELNADNDLYDITAVGFADEIGRAHV